MCLSFVSGTMDSCLYLSTGVCVADSIEVKVRHDKQVSFLNLLKIYIVNTCNTV